MSKRKPFPPGDYPLVVVGSGPGGVQLSYDLMRLAVPHAMLSRDAGPGGMFRRFPMFQRLNTCSRMHAIVPRDEYAFYRYDWNSMVTEEPAHRALVPEFMDGTNYFPTRAEMEKALGEFTRRSRLRVRYDCEWLSIRRDDDGGFVLTTSDGEYRTPAAVFAIGMSEPWRPPIPGIEDTAHYFDLPELGLRHFEGKRVFIIGKRNSAFEVADALLPIAREMILGSPHPTKPSIVTGFPTPPRARYLEPLEDHLFGGGTFVIDVAIQRISRTENGGYRVHTEGTTRPGKRVFEVDEVISTTGFGTPMRDLPGVGVATFYRDRLPAQNAYWESTTAPGIYFAGAPSQGQAGMRKYGWPSRSASIGGFRFNSRVQAVHIARKHFGIEPKRPRIRKDRVVSHLLREATWQPAIWGQQANIARVLSFVPRDGIRDEGLLPLAPFVDSAGPDAVAITVETDREENIQPAVYLRRGGRVTEHVMHPSWTHDYTTREYRDALAKLLRPLVR